MCRQVTHFGVCGHIRSPSHFPVFEWCGRSLLTLFYCFCCHPLPPFSVAGPFPSLILPFWHPSLRSPAISIVVYLSSLSLYLPLPRSPVTILGSENCQSILFQNLLNASEAFQGLWLNTVNWGCKAAAVILPDYCTPQNLPFMSLCPDKAQGYNDKIQSDNISASHFSSQPVMMTG